MCLFRQNNVIFLGLFFLLISCDLWAQNKRGVYRGGSKHKMDLRHRFSHPTDVPRHTIFVEGGGNGLYYSVNYDRITYRQMRKTRSYRIGFNYMPRSNYEDRIRKVQAYETSAIVALNWFRGRETHFFEWGMGYTLRWFQGQNIYKMSDIQKDTYQKFYHLAVPSIGYRRQDAGRTPFFRVALNPIVMFDQTKGSIHFLPFAGVGVGKSF